VNTAAWITVAVVGAAFAVLATTRLAPYLVLLGAVSLLFVGGVIEPAEAFAGLSNEGVITVALLFVVAAGLRETGVLTALIQPLLGRPRTARRAGLRLSAPVAAASAFLNNTPLVAMLLPVVGDWARRIRIPASKLLIPLSYASVLGGLCTLIGTSTNLIVHGLAVDAGVRPLGLFEIGLVGVPCALVGLGILGLLAPKLLPAHDDGAAALEDPREYTMEMVVEPGGPLVGRTVEENGLRHLPGIYLAEIHREGHVIPVVGPEQRLRAGDQLVFAGVVDSVVDMQRRPGLKPATEQLFKLDAPRTERWFVEAVVSHRCPLLGQTIRDGRFRTRYGAVVLGVARGGERVKSRIGDIVLRAGDVLLLEAPPRFVDDHRNANDFYLVTRASDDAPPRHDRAGVALAILAGMVACAATGLLSMLQAALAAAALMLLLRCASQDTARRAIDWQLLLAVAGAFGLGQALYTTGAAAAIANGLLGLAGDHPVWALAALYLATLALSEVVTNNAAAVIMVPIGLEAAAGLGASPVPFVVATMIAASAAFATPLGYQTHLLVYGAGGYRFTDFARLGVVLDAAVFAVALAVIPLAFPF
jgi:di/tricarboxylate transporter